MSWYSIYRGITPVMRSSLYQLSCFFLCNIAPQHDQGMPDLILFRACTAATEARICMCAELNKMGSSDGLQKWALEYAPVFKYFLVGHRLHRHISQTCP